MLDILPASWFVPEMKAMVIDFLRRLPIHPADRKKLYMEWARHSGVAIEAVDIERVTGQPAGTI